MGRLMGRRVKGSNDGCGKGQTRYFWYLCEKGIEREDDVIKTYRSVSIPMMYFESWMDNIVQLSVAFLPG
jgi:hypothetical protein